MEAYLGSICAFGFNFSPYGWQYCNGQTLAISQNAALFALLGTYYGGNGTSTFGLPNLQGRNTIHMGTLNGSQYTIGQSGGTDTVTITTANMPAHTHTVQVSINANNVGGRGASNSPANCFPSVPSGPVYNAAPTTGSVLKSDPLVTLGTAGGSAPITISDPSLVMNFCIAMQGIFPTRN